MDSRRKKDGQNVTDSDSGELAVRSQCDGLDPVLSSSTAVTAKQRTQPQARTKVGKRRVVACFDGRPRRPVQQTVSACWLSTATSGGVPTSSTSSAAAAGSSSGAADVTESSTLPTDGINCLSNAITFSVSVFRSNYPSPPLSSEIPGD